MACAGGYFLLLRELWRTGSFWLTPFFSLYVAALCLYYPVWNPSNYLLLLIAEPILIALKVAAIAEAFLLATRRVSPQERAALLLVLLAVAFSGILMSVGYRFGYQTYRQCAHIGLALASCMGVIAMMLNPPPMWPRVRNHGCILAALMLNFAVTGLCRPRTMEGWLTVSSAFFALSVCCIGCWLWRGLLVCYTPKCIRPSASREGSALHD